MIVMNYSIKILSVLFLLFCNIIAQQNPGTRQIALANSDLYSPDVFSIFNNPSCSYKILQPQAGLYYSPAPFEIQELSTAYAAYSHPTQIGTFSFGSMVYGFELYKETEIDVSYSQGINDCLDLGFTLRYKNISIKNYGSTGIFLMNLGTSIELSHNLAVAFFIENLSHATLNNEPNQLPTVMSLGLTSGYIQNFTLSAAVRKEIGFNPSIRFGVEHKILEYLSLRFGVSNEPDIYCCGIGIFYKVLEFGYACSSHPDLGLTHQFDLIFRSP
jgi:hypothetical protein